MGDGQKVSVIMDRKQSRNEAGSYPIATPLRTVLALVILFLALVSGASGQERGGGIDLSTSGFGGWAYGISNGNRYLVGSESGEYENGDFSLNFRANLRPQFAVVAQVQFQGSRDDFRADLDYGFLQWRFSGRTILNFGRVKHPFGIYSEFFDLGTERPFLTLPQGIYGPQGFTAESYEGVGVHGSWLGKRAELDYDVYAGKILGEVELPAGLTSVTMAPIAGVEVLGPRELGQRLDDFEVKEMVGVRLNAGPRTSYLRLGFSAYVGKQVFEGSSVIAGILPEAVEERNYGVVAGHVDYTGELWWLRFEAGSFENDGFVRSTAAYGEIARFMSPRWQLALRYDFFDAEIPCANKAPSCLAPALLESGIPFETVTDFLLRHEDLAFGLNYWVGRSGGQVTTVVKLSYHRVEGNRFAFPASLAEQRDAFMGGGIRGTTDLVALGVQFSFSPKLFASP